MEFLDKNGLQHMLESLKPHISSSTPDWNASVSQDGHIKNRTHYEEKEVFFEKQTTDMTEGGTFYVPKSSVPLSIWSDTGAVDGKPNQRVEIPCYGGHLVLDLTYMGSQWQVYVVQSPVVPQTIYFGQYYVHTLATKYIPDTIARQEYVESLEARIQQLEEKIANL